MRKAKYRKQDKRAKTKSVDAYKKLSGKEKREQAAAKKASGRSRWKANKEAKAAAEAS